MAWSTFMLVFSSFRLTFSDYPLDPCVNGLHKSLSKDNLGSRNENCPTAPVHLTICDHFLSSDWYSAYDAVILNRCPQNGQCGASYQIWMNGTFPAVEDQIVNRTACIRKPGNCCDEKIEIKIKNCTRFYVYYLSPPETCPTVYCFDSSLPCSATTSTTTTKTQFTTTIAVPDIPSPRCDFICIIIIVLLLFIIALIIVVAVLFKCCRKPPRTASIEKELSLPPPYSPPMTKPNK